MFYRVRTDLAFTESDEAFDFYHDAQIALPKSQCINPGHNTQESGTIVIEMCYHDEPGNKPCEILDQDTICP